MISLRFHFSCKLQLLVLRFVLLLLAALPRVAMAQTPENNLQMLLPLFDRVAGRVGEELSRSEQTAVWLQPSPNAKPEERFFASRLVTVLKDSLRFAVFAEPAAALKMAALTTQLARCEVVYRKLPRRRFWLKARWQRTANVVLEAEAQNPTTRQIDFQKIFAESRADTVAEKFLSRLEEASLPFTLGRREESENGPRWLEPVLITSATGAVVYLFYALRSR